MIQVADINLVARWLRLMLLRRLLLHAARLLVLHGHLTALPLIAHTTARLLG